MSLAMRQPNSIQEHIERDEAMDRTPAFEDDEWAAEPECECEGNGDVTSAWGCPVHGKRREDAA